MTCPPRPSRCHDDEEDYYEDEEYDDDDDAEGEDDDDHLEKVLHSEPTSTTLSPTTSPHSEQICE